MRRLCSMLLTVSVLVGCLGSALGASEHALKLRAQNGLAEYAPSEGFLSGNFVAVELEVPSPSSFGDTGHRSAARIDPCLPVG